MKNRYIPIKMYRHIYEHTVAIADQDTKHFTFFFFSLVEIQNGTTSAWQPLIKLNIQKNKLTIQPSYPI